MAKRYPIIKYLSVIKNKIRIFSIWLVRKTPIAFLVEFYECEIKKKYK